MAVLHREHSDGVHVHILTARCDLETSRSLNIAPPGRQKTLGPLRDGFNHQYGWSRPDDPIGRLRRTLIRDGARLRNRTHKTFDPSGVRVQGVISDLFGVNGLRILDGLVQAVPTGPHWSLRHHGSATVLDDEYNASCG